MMIRLIIAIVTMRARTIFHADYREYENVNYNDDDDDAAATHDDDDDAGNCVLISEASVSHLGIDWGGDMAPRSGRRSLRPTASVHEDVSYTQSALAKAVDQVCQQADRKLLEAESSGGTSSEGALWKKVEDYMKTDPNILVEDAINLLAETVCEGDQDAADRFVTEKLASAGVPQAPGIFISNVLQFNFSESGHWRGEPCNQEVRKMARSMSMSTFRQAWH